MKTEIISLSPKR
ncbi:rCG22475 [Rattus norvegicus]|uniref:RCG22475 n=1 Tax=Rattus norvegicus TaxID=10116 RepID=A6INT0_RAT|nr:rCG22475 [Rattus norvegicus]